MYIFAELGQLFIYDMTRKRLYIFNPEHDLALASGESNYMAPASARQMANDLALLPMWYADPGNAVLAPSAYNADFLKQMQVLLHVNVELITAPEIVDGGSWEFSPWGYNLALRKRLLAVGASPFDLYSEEYVTALRKFSHRLQAVKLLSKLQLSNCFCGESFYLENLKECESFVIGRPICILKAPLSGSGKGLNWCKGQMTSFISGWCNRVIHSQGGLIGEPVYDKVEDFAMEFYSDGKGKVSFAGYSVFSTNKSGMYLGNELLTDDKMKQRLSKFVPLCELERLQTRLEEELSALLGSFYQGYMGVDMMICHFPNETVVYKIHPCVEINLRMNMGVVSRLLTDRYIASTAEGFFRIVYYPIEGVALEEHQKMLATYPLLIEEGRIRSGYLPLVPVSAQSRYRVFCCCH